MVFVVDMFGVYSPDTWWYKRTMTIDDAKACCLRELTPYTPRSLEWLAAQQGAERRKGKRTYSRTAFKIYTLLGRALQALKKTGEVNYRSKAAGGPGWVRGRS